METVDVQTRDGRWLRATVREPSRTERARGVAVLAHAMFARRSQWERGFAAFLAERGWRTIAFDFRGHGDSGPAAAKGGSWSYEDLVRHDLPAVVDGARARAKGRKVVVVGHSLGGHVAAAAQATGAMEVDRIALVASNVWLRALEPSPVRFAAKTAVARSVEAVVDRRGFFPARALRLGSDDEAGPYMRHIWRAVSRGFWGSEDGRLDYWDALRQLRTPLVALSSDADPLNCHPECSARFALRAVGPVTIERLRAADDGGAAPGHMEMLTTTASASAWGRMERWLRG
jgi:predicted alpha/beta hydrolase